MFFFFLFVWCFFLGGGCNGRILGCYGICNVICFPVWVIISYHSTGTKLDGEAQLWRLPCLGQTSPSVYLWPALFPAPRAASIWQLERESRGKALDTLPTLCTAFKLYLAFKSNGQLFAILHGLSHLWCSTHLYAHAFNSIWWLATEAVRFSSGVFEKALSAHNTGWVSLYIFHFSIVVYLSCDIFSTLSTCFDGVVVNTAYYG